MSKHTAAVSTQNPREIINCLYVMKELNVMKSLKEITLSFQYLWFQWQEFTTSFESE